MYNAGDFNTTETVHIPVNSFSSDDPTASVTITNLAAGDVEIHKDGSTTQRASDSGVTVTIDFDSVTGNHMINIDLSDDTDSGYYANGSRYLVRIEGTTVDGGTINAWVGGFSIGCALRPTTAGRTLDIQSTGEVDSNLTMMGGVAQSATDLKDLADTGYDPSTHKIQGVVTADTCTTNTDMRGTDGANTTTPPTVSEIQTELEENGASILDTLQDRLTADRAGYLDNLSAGAVATAAKLLAYIQLLSRSDAAIETDNATELTAINADGGSGAGDFSAQTDSVEALKDHIGDGTNLTEAGGDGDHLTEAGGTGDQLTAVQLHGDYDAAKTAAQAGDNMNLADNAITASKHDESTSFPLASADTGSTEVARTGADGDTLETISDQIDTVPNAAAINAEVDTALSDYDPPTKAELDTAVADVSVDEIQASAIADLFNTDSGTDYDSAVVGSAVKEIADNVDNSIIQDNSLGKIVVEPIMDIPSAGTNQYRIEFYLYDMAGNMEAPDSAPTIAIVNQDGTDRSGNLDGDTTMDLVSTGRYREIYNVASDHAAESIMITVSVVEGTETRIYSVPVKVQDEIGNKIDSMYTIFMSTHAELAGVPAHGASLSDKLEFMFMALKNESVADNSGETATISVANNAGSSIASADITETADTSTKGKYL